MVLTGDKKPEEDQQNGVKEDNPVDSTAAVQKPQQSRQMIGKGDRPLANMADLVEKNWESIE